MLAWSAVTSHDTCTRLQWPKTITHYTMETRTPSLQLTNKSINNSAINKWVSISYMRTRSLLAWIRLPAADPQDPGATSSSSRPYKKGDERQTQTPPRRLPSPSPPASSGPEQSREPPDRPPLTSQRGGEPPGSAPASSHPPLPARRGRAGPCRTMRGRGGGAGREEARRGGSWVKEAGE